jgi:small-conductance mechanosensitive channel
LQKNIFKQDGREDWSQAQPILLTTIKRALDKSGIEIPFPQRAI